MPRRLQCSSVSSSLAVSMLVQVRCRQTGRPSLRINDASSSDRSCVEPPADRSDRSERPRSYRPR